jgi:hypothetical protein
MEWMVMPDNVRGPLLSNGHPGQVLIMDPEGSKRTAWTDPSNLGIGGGEPPPVQESPIEFLTANRVYYVNGETGSDLNDGLTSETAFKTILRGISEAGKVYVSKYRVNINVAPATYIAPPGGWTLPTYAPAQYFHSSGNYRAFNLLGSEEARCILQFETPGMAPSPILNVNGSWRVGGFTFKVGGTETGILMRRGGDLKLDAATFENIVPATSPVGIRCEGGTFDNGGYHTFKGPQWKSLFQFIRTEVDQGSVIVNDNPTVDDAFVDVTGGYVDFRSALNEATSTVVGKKFLARDMAVLWYRATGALPGSLPGELFGNSIYNGSATPPVLMSSSTGKK